MASTPNIFKQALRAGRPQIGLWLSLADPYSAEMLAGAGFDWLLIDGEHAPQRPAPDARDAAGDRQRALPSAGRRRFPCPVVRPVIGDTALIKQVLEIGAQTILVPMVETAEQAQRLVAAVRYPPRGNRGVGSSAARSSRWSGIPDYAKDADEQICLLVQAETVTAMANLEAIAAVDGIDGVFFGPADLSASMGLLGQTEHPQVKAAIDDGIRRVRAAGKAPGVLTIDQALARHYLDEGALFVAVGVEASLLARAARDLAAAFAGAAAPGPTGERPAGQSRRPGRRPAVRRGAGARPAAGAQPLPRPGGRRRPGGPARADRRLRPRADDRRCASSSSPRWPPAGWRWCSRRPASRRAARSSARSGCSPASPPCGRSRASSRKRRPGRRSLAGVAAFVFVAALVGGSLSATADPLRASVIGTCLGWGSGALAVLGASALLGQIGIALGTACAGAALAQMLRGGPAPSGWSVGLPASLGAALVGVLAVATGELRWYFLLPLLIVPFAARWVPSGDSRRHWQYAFLAGFAALVPVVAAIAWAWMSARMAASAG